MNIEDTTKQPFICSNCGSELKFFNEQLEQMEYCPYCAASIYTSHKNKYNTVKQILKYFVDSFGKNLVQNVIYELKLTPRPPLGATIPLSIFSKTNNH